MLYNIYITNEQFIVDCSWFIANPDRAGAAAISRQIDSEFDLHYAKQSQFSWTLNERKVIFSNQLRPFLGFVLAKNKANSKPNKANLLKTRMTALKARLTEYDYAKQSQFLKKAKVKR